MSINGKSVISILCPHKLDLFTWKLFLQGASEYSILIGQSRFHVSLPCEYKTTDNNASFVL